MIFFVYGLFIFIICLIWSLNLSTVLGAPFVPTNFRLAEEILKEAHLRKNQMFLDLGCGDGRLLRIAVGKYGTKGMGIEINLLLLLFAKIVTKITGLRNIEYRWGSVLKTSLSHAEVIYFYLMPKMIDKLRPRLEKEAKKGALIISHRFEIPGWESKLTKIVGRTRPYTYFYKT